MAFVALEVAKKLASQSQIEVMRSKMARMIIRPKNMKTQVRRGVSSRVGKRKQEKERKKTYEASLKCVTVSLFVNPNYSETSKLV